MYQPRAKLGLKSESSIDQRDHRIEVFAENGERHGRVGQNARIVPRRLDRAASEVDPFRPDRVPIWGVEACGQVLAALRRKPKGGAVNAGHGQSHPQAAPALAACGG